MVSRGCVQDKKTRGNTYPGIVTLLFVVRQQDPLRTAPNAFHNVQVVLEHSDRLEDHT